MTSASPALPQVLASSGTADWVLAYCIVIGAMAVGLQTRRASAARYWRAPLSAIAVLVAGGMLWSLLAHAVPRALTRDLGAVFLAGLGFWVGRWLPARLPDATHKRGAQVREHSQRAAVDVHGSHAQDLTLAG